MGRSEAFCATRGVALHSLDYYRHRERVRRQDGEAEQLVPVELIDPAGAVGGLRVELANGRRLVVESGFDASHLRRLLAVLEG
jgi:hypothetical protein